VHQGSTCIDLLISTYGRPAEDGATDTATAEEVILDELQVGVKVERLRIYVARLA